MEGSAVQIPVPLYNNTVMLNDGTSFKVETGVVGDNVNGDRYAPSVKIGTKYIKGAEDLIEVFKEIGVPTENLDPFIMNRITLYNDSKQATTATKLLQQSILDYIVKEKKIKEKNVITTATTYGSYFDNLLIRF